MNIMSREELKMKLDRGENVKLIMTLDRQAYEKMHIPGSLHFPNILDALKALDVEDEVIVYCSNPKCPVSIHAYYVLARHGFRRLFRYAGGLAEWQEAGYPLEGLMAQPAPV